MMARPAVLPRTSPAAPSGPSVSYRGLQLLVALPLSLALFALALQFLGNAPHQPAHIHLHANLAREKEEYTQLPGAGAGAGGGAAGWDPQLPWRPGGVDPKGPKIAFCVTTSENLRQIRQWVAYHRLVGVSAFYLFVDGPTSHASAIAQLERIPSVKVVPHDERLKARHAKSRIWHESWLSAFFHKPCNHELFVLQSLNMEVAIEMAMADGMDWILHIDTDELVHPGGLRDFSLQALLASFPASVDNVVLPNYESLPERADVEEPFLEVTLFKKNYEHVVSDLYFKNYHAIAHGNPNYFIAYGNGKSAARIKPGLRSNGAHRFHNYFHHPKEVTAAEGAVLHYTYSRLRDLRSRRDRCDCAPTEADAERCFILPFDRQAFLAASLKSDAELQRWFRERLLWDKPKKVADLIKKGLLMRTYLPQVVMKGLDHAERVALAAEGSAVAAQAQPEPQQPPESEVAAADAADEAEVGAAAAAANA